MKYLINDNQNIHKSGALEIRWLDEHVDKYRVAVIITEYHITLY